MSVTAFRALRATAAKKIPFAATAAPDISFATRTNKFPAFIISVPQKHKNSKRGKKAPLQAAILD
jgi:hypothetical protein